MVSVTGRCLQILDEILHPDLLIRDSPLTLREERQPAQHGVRIHRSGPLLAVRLDAWDNHRRFPWLSLQVRHLTEICDHALIAPPLTPEEPIRVLLLELKSRRVEGAAAQIANARLLLDWLLAVAAHHRGLDVNRVEVRGIVVSDDVPGQRFEARDLAPRFRNTPLRPAGVPVIYLRRSRQSDTQLSFEACFGS